MWHTRPVLITAAATQQEAEAVRIFGDTNKCLCSTAHVEESSEGSLGGWKLAWSSGVPVAVFLRPSRFSGGVSDSTTSLVVPLAAAAVRAWPPWGSGNPTSLGLAQLSSHLWWKASAQRGGHSKGGLTTSP